MVDEDGELLHSDKSIEKHREKLHEDLKEASHELYEAMIISFINLMFPISIIIKKYFLNKTGRNASIFGVLTIIELALFILELMWISDYSRYKAYDETNKWAEGDYGGEENFMLNIIWYIHCNNPYSDEDVIACELSSTYRFDYMLAMVAFFTWLKLIFYFRVSHTFGPLFKMMQ